MRSISMNTNSFLKCISFVLIPSLPQYSHSSRFYFQTPSSHSRTYAACGCVCPHHSLSSLHALPFLPLSLMIQELSSLLSPHKHTLTATHIPATPMASYSSTAAAVFCFLLLSFHCACESESSQYCFFLAFRLLTSFLLSSLI